MTLSSSTVFFSLVVIVAAFTGSVSALSCAQCQPEQIAKCAELSCPKSERVIAWEACSCCPVCTRKLGEKCTERLPCDSDLICYTLDREPTLPWFYNGICVTNETFQSLPKEPTPCDCDRLSWEQEQQQQPGSQWVQSTQIVTDITTESTLDAVTVSDTPAAAEKTEAVPPPIIPAVEVLDATAAPDEAEAEQNIEKTAVIVGGVTDTSYSPTTKDTASSDKETSSSDTPTQKTLKEETTEVNEETTTQSSNELVESFFRWLKSQFDTRHT